MSPGVTLPRFPVRSKFQPTQSLVQRKYSILVQMPHRRLSLCNSRSLPGKANFSDCRMGPILERMDDHHTLVPMILGEVLRSLSFCSTKRRAFFFGCASLSLLQIWFLEHLTDFRSIRINGFFDIDYIHHYSLYCQNPNEIPTGAAHLSNLPYEKIVWRVRWLPAHRVIMKCPGLCTSYRIPWHGSIHTRSSSRSG
jgi:hypothetical protein